MNSTGDFQDLLNITGTSQELDVITNDITALQSDVDANTAAIDGINLEITALQDSVDSNTAEITSNTLNIGINSGNISTTILGLASEIQRATAAEQNNATNISTNSADIGTNATAIGTNATNIGTNTTAISTNSADIGLIQNSYLNKDGSVILDSGYTPTAGQGLATKTYVDNHSTSSNYLKLDGTSAMTGDLNIGSNNIINASLINGENITTMATDISSNFTEIGFLRFNVGSLTYNLGLVQASYLNKDGSVIMSGDLDVGRNNIINASLINGENITTMSTDISSNTSAVNANTSNITENATDIGINSSLISDNYDRFLNNESDITALQSGKVSKAGDIMSGDLNIGSNNIINASLINGENITTMSTDITENATDIGINSSLISDNYDRFLNNESDISALQSGKISKAGDSMSGDLDMVDNSIIGAHDIQTNSISDVGSQIEVKTSLLKINGGGGDCELRICADENNNNENYNSRIVFQQDGSYQEAAVWMGDNQLNLSSSISDGGINFRTTTTANAWETAPVRMSIDTTGDVVIETNLRVNSSKSTNVGSFRYYAYGGYGGFASGSVNVAVYCPSGRVVAQEFDATSDRRCKTDIENIPDDVVDAFMRLESKQYYWKDEKESLKYGFIAQDVIKQDIMPLVNFAESQGMMGGVDEETGVNNPPDICMNLNYDSMVPLLHGALKRSMDRTAELEHRIETLEQTISAMI